MCTYETNDRSNVVGSWAAEAYVLGICEYTPSLPGAAFRFLRQLTSQARRKGQCGREKADNPPRRQPELHVCLDNRHRCHAPARLFLHAYSRRLPTPIHRDTLNGEKEVESREDSRSKKEKLPPAKRVSIVNNGIFLVSPEALSRQRERTGEVDKKRGIRKQRRAGGEREGGKGEGRERMGEKQTAKDSERRTYQEVPTAVRSVRSMVDAARSRDQGDEIRKGGLKAGIWS
ncbi:hypothetical protein B0H14DRAFT_2630239 [Mycena olivaceomarginata]|nr:hypothetical protein B0H14DRAFT_2630239 [Mycena olivaceomarginata]